MALPLPPEVLFLSGAVRQVLPMPYRETDREERFAMAIKERNASFTASASGKARITSGKILPVSPAGYSLSLFFPNR
jgi:hypothetical protein